MHRMRDADCVVTLIGFVQNDDGTESVADIVETCRHYAYRFYSKFVRDEQICRITVERRDAPQTRRTIYKGLGRNAPLEYSVLR